MESRRSFRGNGIRGVAGLQLIPLAFGLLCLLTPLSSAGRNVLKVDFPDGILQKEFAVQCRAVDSLNAILNGHDRDSVRQAMQRMAARAEEEEDLNLHYLLRLRALSRKEKKDSDYESELLELVQLLKEKKRIHLQAEATQQLADFYWEQKNYSASLEKYLFAYDLYAPLPADEFPHKPEFLYTLGLRYYHFRDFESAKKYFLETWQTIPVEQINNPPSKLNTLGLCYGNLEKMDSSNFYLRKAMAAAEEKNDEVWIGIISGNLANNFMKEKKYDQARPLIERNIEMSTRNHQMMDLVFALSGYGELLLINKENEKALEMELKALAILWEKKFKGFSFQYRVFPNVAKAYAANGNMEMAYAYMDSAYVARDSFLVERNAVFVSGVQHKIDVEKHKAELNDTAEEARRQNLFKYVLMAGILLMFLLATVFFLQQRKLRKTHSQLIQSEKLAALGQLSASIAHEVNTPLGGIKSSAEESLAAFQEFQSGLLWMTQTLNEEEKNLFLNFLATANPMNVAHSTREEREIKKTLRETFAQMGIENGRFLSERLVQVGIYELSPELEQLSRLPHFEKMLLLAFNLFNQQHSNRTIVTAVDKASRIVKAMKTYLHSANSDQMEEVDLRDNIETVLTIYQNRLKQGVQVIKNYEANPVLTGYPDQLNQIWTNLIVNAVQAMDNQGILTISILEVGNEVVVKIKDTGKGIPKAIQSKIFSPFFTTKKAGEGSGLGLHIIRRIVKEHSGTIDFESVEGEGTTFIVKFPIRHSV